MDTDFEPYLGERGLDKALELCERLTQKIFKGTDTGVPYRALNHWGKLGLLDDSREDIKNWRRFSFVEYVWIRAIQELRLVDLNLVAIKALKEVLLAPTSLIDLSSLFINIYGAENLTNPKKTEETQKKEVDFWTFVLSNPKAEEMGYNWLQLMIATSISKRCPVILIVFPDGEFFSVEETPGFILPSEILDRLSFETHVRIPITGIVREFLAKDLSIDRIGMLEILEPNEQAILSIINSGKYKAVKIHFKNAKMNDLELVQSQDTRRKIVDILASGEYQTISVDQHEGQITKIENTIKYKFPK